MEPRASMVLETTPVSARLDTPVNTVVIESDERIRFRTIRFDMIRQCALKC